jgi:hypothetical protein
MTTYRVSAQVSVEGGPWEPYEAAIEGADDPVAMPSPDEFVPDIQHHVAVAKGTTAIAVRVREVEVSGAADADG